MHSETRIQRNSFITNNTFGPAAALLCKTKKATSITNFGYNERKIRCRRNLCCSGVELPLLHQKIYISVLHCRLYVTYRGGTFSRWNRQSGRQQGCDHYDLWERGRKRYIYIYREREREVGCVLVRSYTLFLIKEPVKPG